MNVVPLRVVPRKKSDRIAVTIVDDSAVVRRLFARWLTEAGDIEIVGSCGNGRELLNHIEGTTPDVILLDLSMPELGGLDTLPQIMAKAPDMQVLVVSSMSLEGVDQTLRCLLRGAAHCLPKPSALDGTDSTEAFRVKLIETVRKLARPE